MLAFALIAAWYGRLPDAGWLWVPLLVLWTLLVALSAGLWLSALSVRYRDVRHLLPFLVQIWLFITPVVYPASLFPGAYRPWLGLNPMAGVVETFRWGLLHTGALHVGVVAVSLGVTFSLLASGAAFFRRTERSFADVV